MSAVPYRSYLAQILAAWLLLPAASGSAQMVPLQDLRQDFSMATYFGVTESRTNRPPVPFGHWEDFDTVQVDEYQPCQDSPPDQCLVGSCWASSYQNSEFFPGGLQFSGTTGAGWGIPPGGADWSFLSSSAFLFRVDTTFDYDFYINVDQGDWPALGGTLGGAVLLNQGGVGGIPLENITAGPIAISERLGPGTYYIEGFASGGGPWESFTGATYFGQFLVHPVSQPIITTQPPDVTTGPGGTIIDPIRTRGPQFTYAYQWRKNHTPLTDNSHVMGTGTATLRIINATLADEGDYDVVVTGPDPATGVTVSEPSRLAHVHILTTTGVSEEPSNSVPSATVRAPAPNPFRVSTSIGYEVGPASRLVATVYNASGAKVRTLADRTVSGAGSVTWDGRLPSGAHAPAGIYFVRVETDGVRETRKVVLLQ